MKNVLRLLVFAALVTVFALPAYAQDAAGQTPAATTGQTPAATGPCAEAEAKAALYTKFRENFNKTAEQQKTAYDAGKEYLSKYGACTDPADVTIIKYIQNWITKYEAATLKFNCTKAVNENPTQAFTLCEPYIRANPDALEPQLMLVAAGLKNAQANNKATNAQAAAAARRAIQLIEQGKTVTEWAPLPSQAEALPRLNYYIGYFTLDTAPAEAATFLVKAAQSNSPIAKEPSTYEILAAAYFKNEFTPLANEYKNKCEGKEATPECDALFNKINAVTHRLADAYARATALTTDAAAKDKRKANFETFYKQLHEGKTDGMNEYLANVLSKPIMLPGKEPAPPTPPATPSADSTTNGAGGTATTTTPASGTTPPKPAATPTPTAKPTPTPQQKPPRL